MRSFCRSVCLAALLCFASAARADGDAYAQRIYQRLTGSALMPDAPLRQRMTSYLRNDDRYAAAMVALGERSFYSVTLRNVAAPMSGREELVSEPLNDLQALIVGLARDDLDARLMLTGNFTYQAHPSLLLPAVSRANNDHYTAFEAAGRDPWSDLTRVAPQWSDATAAAGALTTRAWAKAHYDAGTNRRAVEYTFRTFLCAPKEQIRDRSVTDTFVRRDIDRAPGEDPTVYQSHCRLCHGIIDGLGGAFAKVDFVSGRFVSSPTVVAKMNQNASVEPNGYVTFDDRWVNFAVSHHNQEFGWRGPTEGRGLPAFAAMVANSEGFSRCLVRRVVKQVCKDERPEPERVEQLRRAFEQNGYKLKDLFARTAIDPACIAHE